MPNEGRKSSESAIASPSKSNSDVETRSNDSSRRSASDVASNKEQRDKLTGRMVEPGPTTKTGKSKSDAVDRRQSDASGAPSSGEAKRVKKSSDPVVADPGGGRGRGKRAQDLPERQPAGFHPLRSLRNIFFGYRKNERDPVGDVSPKAKSTDDIDQVQSVRIQSMKKRLINILLVVFLSVLCRPIY